MGLDRQETETILHRWGESLSDEDSSSRQHFTDIEQDGYTGSDDEREPTEELERFRKCMSWLHHNIAEDSPRRKRLESPVEEIFLEQIALGLALCEDGVFVLARCQSEPWFWRLLKKKGIVPCKEISEEDWLKDEIAEKKSWLKVRGIHQLMYAGLRFGFIHFVFPDPNLLRDSIAATLAAGWALYTDP
jgi:hypothetical protein